MRAFVLSDDSLASRAGQFVWLEIDTEQEKNAAFLERYPIEGVPTFFVIDAQAETALQNRIGSMTLAQLHTFLDEGRQASPRAPLRTEAQAAEAAKASARADAALARAARLAAGKQPKDAVTALREALAAAPADWPAYGRAVEMLVEAYSGSEDPRACVDLARTTLPRLAGTTPALAVAQYGLECAQQLPEAERAAAVAPAEAALRAQIDDARVEAAADDRSGAYIALLESRKKANDAAGARQVAQQWAAFLEQAAGKAKSPDERAVFDSHRLAAYLELEQPERALPMLLASEKDLPDDYNPPARLAVVYNALKRWDDALAAADRALPRMTGPRRLRVLDAKVEAQQGKGDVAGARRTLEEAIAFAEKLPAGRGASRAKALRVKLEALAPPS
jgi:hypothetical protein